MVRKAQKEEWKIYGNVFDEFTLRTLFHMSGQGLFDGLKSPVAIGKESNVFTAEKGDELVIVKIYRLESCDFNRMWDYIGTDPRFEGVRNRRRQIIFSWTQREYRNLLIAREGGVKCPRPHQFENNVLVMDIVGGPAPRLIQATPEDPKAFFGLLIKECKKLYKSGICHGDLSEYNILNNNEEPWLIDFSHGTPLDCELGKRLFIRDCENLARYFTKVWKKITVEEIIKKIRGKQRIVS